jgi:hypothetical protein
MNGTSVKKNAEVKMVRAEGLCLIVEDEENFIDLHTKILAHPEDYPLRMQTGTSSAAKMSRRGGSVRSSRKAASNSCQRSQRCPLSQKERIGFGVKIPANVRFINTTARESRKRINPASLKFRNEEKVRTIKIFPNTVIPLLLMK